MVGLLETLDFPAVARQALFFPTEVIHPGAREPEAPMAPSLSLCSQGHPELHFLKVHTSHSSTGSETLHVNSPRPQKLIREYF